MEAKDLQKYLLKVGIRSVEFDYCDDILLNNLQYFKVCCAKGISEYTSLNLLKEYLSGEYEL